MFGKSNLFDIIKSVTSSTSSGSSSSSSYRSYGSGIVRGDDPIKNLKQSIETSTKIIEAIVEAPEDGAKKTAKKIAEAIKEDVQSRDPINTYTKDAEKVEKFIKKVKGEEIIEKVLPIAGCIVYCDLGSFEHTGIYIGGNRIIELDGGGRIRTVSPGTFLDSSLYRTSTKIYIACDNKGKVLYNPQIADRAVQMVGKSRNYNLIMDNCHQFTCGCIIDDFENSNNFFTFVEHTISTELNNGDHIKWLPWDRKYWFNISKWFKAL